MDKAGRQGVDNTENCQENTGGAALRFSENLFDNSRQLAVNLLIVNPLRGINFIVSVFYKIISATRNSP